MSGADWLPEVPRHWAICPLGFRYEVQLGKMLNPDAAAGEHPAPYLRNTDVQWGRINTDDLPLMSFDAKERAKFALRAGDLLVCEGGDIGRAAEWKGELVECFYQKALHRVRPLRTTEVTRFFYFVLAAASWRGAFLAEGNRSTIVHLTAEKLRAMRFPFPPYQEQRAIADFLDRKTAAIDALIEKKELLLQVLAEKKVGAASMLALKGLRSDAPTKDSGIPSIGRVPAHWRVQRAKTQFREFTERAGDSDLELLTVSHITGITPRREKPDVTMFLAESAEANKVCRRDDLVVNTMWAWMGAAGVAPCDGMVSPSYNVYRLRHPHEVEPRFFDLLFRAPPFVAEMNRLSKGITASRLRLYPEALLNMRLMLPPKGEQTAILEAVERLTARDVVEARRLQQSVKLLREYRLAIITAAVTGQLDVTREAA